MSGPTLEQMMDLAVDHARRLIGTVEMLLPIVHVVNGRGQGLVVGLQSPSLRSKEAEPDVLRRLCRDHRAHRAVMVREAWLAAVAEGDADPELQAALAGRIRVSDLPRAKRVDTLVVVGEELGRVTRTRLYAIVGEHPGRQVTGDTLEGFGEREHPLTSHRWYPMLPGNVIAERLNRRRS